MRLFLVIFQHCVDGVASWGNSGKWWSVRSVEWYRGFQSHFTLAEHWINQIPSCASYCALRCLSLNFNSDFIANDASSCLVTTILLRSVGRSSQYLRYSRFWPIKSHQKSSFARSQSWKQSLPVIEEWKMWNLLCVDTESKFLLKMSNRSSQCWKISQKVSFYKIASEASYVYYLQKFIINISANAIFGIFRYFWR